MSSLAIETADGRIRILDGPHFCATKLEAFFSRGEGDLYHHDLEDFIAVVDGRPGLVDEIKASPKELREFLAQETAGLLAREAFLEALPGHLHADAASQSRLPLVLLRLREIATLAAQPAVSSPTVPTRAAPARTAQPGRLGPSGSSGPAPTAGLDHSFVRSSNLRAASYDATASTLTIEFRSGGLYSYSAVPATIYAGLLNAASAGRYLNVWIKGRYRVHRLR